MSYRRVMSKVGNQICDNIANVSQRISEAVKKRAVTVGLGVNQNIPHPRLVCVSKTKPAADIITAYDSGQRHFGENYVNELEEKSNSLISVCPDIRWHFIGHLQSNKVNKLIGCPNLFMLETVDSTKLADRIEKACASSDRESKLNVMVQINTSREEQKSGVMPEKACSLITHIMENCPHLKFFGIMTIGSFSHDYSSGPNPDFVALMKCKEEVIERLSLPAEEVEVSMGMSNDFEYAIEMGSTNVRVGSTIFGAREYKQKPA